MALILRYLTLLVGATNVLPAAVALGVALLSLGAVGVYVRDQRIKREAVAAFEASTLKKEQARAKTAQEADDLVRRCASDHACRMRDDGYRRD